MFTKLFWVDAIERAIATAAQFLLVVGGADGAGFIDIDLKKTALLALAGAAAAVLKAVVAATKAKTDTASFTVDTAEEL